MNFLELENLSLILRRCLEITFVCGVFVTVLLSAILKKYFAYYFVGDPGYYRACLIILTPCGVLALIILRHLILIMKSINQKNPFAPSNVKYLKRIAMAAFGISILFFVMVVFYATLLTFIVGYIFLIAGFACLVFSKLFQKAVDYKNENDLTI